jgi:hypothetical protein
MILNQSKFLLVKHVSGPESGRKKIEENWGFSSQPDNSGKSWGWAIAHLG